MTYSYTVFKTLHEVSLPSHKFTQLPCLY